MAGGGALGVAKDLGASHFSPEPRAEPRASSFICSPGQLLSQASKSPVHCCSGHGHRHLGANQAPAMVSAGGVMPPAHMLLLACTPAIATCCSCWAGVVAQCSPPLFSTQMPTIPAACSAALSVCSLVLTHGCPIHPRVGKGLPASAQ